MKLYLAREQNKLSKFWLFLLKGVFVFVRQFVNAPVMFDALF